MTVDNMVQVPRTTLEWWAELAEINPQDLRPRIQAYLNTAPAEDKSVLRPLGKLGDHMTAEDFEECVQCSCFIPYDGDGNWATVDGESKLNVWENARPEWATHVVWYNK